MSPHSKTSWRSGKILQNLDSIFFVLLFLVFYVSFFPGILNIDATYQLNAALTHFRDWHSPIMTWIWAGLNHLYVGPALMLLLIQLELFSGLYLLLHLTIPSAIIRCLGTTCLILLPMAFPIFGYEMKDSFFCANLLLGFALATLSSVSHHTRPQRFIYTFSALVFLFLATATRPDGAAAIIPPIGWMAWNWLKIFPSHSFAFNRFGSVVLYFFAGTLVSITFCLGVNIANIILCEGWKDYPEQVVMDHDLAGISIADNQLHFPPSRLSEGATLKSLKAVYTPANSWAIFFPKNAPLQPVRINHQKEYNELAAAWIGTIRNHPLLYLQNRLTTFVAMVGLQGPLPDTHELSWGSYPKTFGNFASYAAVHGEFSPGRLIRWEQWLHDLVEPFFLFRPIVYILLALGCIGYQLCSGRLDRLPNQASLVLALSGLAHLLVFFICAPSAEIRFAFWLTFSSLLSTLLICADFITHEPQKPTDRL